MLIKFDLKDFAHTEAVNLSGGNKRKLICAVAMMGRPETVFIDEASAGVDPGARRILWYGMKEEGKNSAMIITTHAMEEAEALCHKLAIMAKGRFKCFGSLQQIQQEYGGGFEMEFNLEQGYFHELEAKMPINE